MSKGRGALALALLAAALLLATLSQLYFRRLPEYGWDGLFFAVLAAACFLLGHRASRPAAGRARASALPRSHLGTWLRRYPLPGGLIASGLVLSALATLLAEGRAWNQGTWDVVLIWLLALVALLLAALVPAGGVGLPWRPIRLLGRIVARLRAVSRAAWIEIATLAGLTLLALTLRVAALGAVPFTLGGDEAWHGLLARQVLRDELRNPFVMGYMSMPTFFYWPLSWSLGIVGDSVAGLRLPAALAGTAAVPFLYLLARRLWGRRVAFLAAAFLATWDYAVHYSRLGANNIWDPLFVVLALWLVDRGVAAWLAHGEGEGRSAAPWFLLAGLVMGLSLYFYTGARLLPALVALYLAHAWLNRRSTASRWAKVSDRAHSDAGWAKVSDRAPSLPLSSLAPYVALMALAYLIAAGPMLRLALAQPDEWNARLNQVGILQSGWLAREPGLTGKSTLQILAEQFLRAAGAFHVFADRTVWYGAARPLLGFLAGILALLGMAGSLARWRERGHFLVLAWFWAVIVTGGMLTESPPSSQRLVMAIPAVALLVATGLDQTVGLGARLLKARPVWTSVVLAIVTLALGVGSIYYYFVEYLPARRYGGENGETATMIGHYLRSLEGDTQAYLIGAPKLYWAFGSMAFLAPGVSGQDVLDPLQVPPVLDGARSAVFLFLPERASELDAIRRAYPTGRVREFRDDVGRLRFTAYELPAAQGSPALAL